VTASSIDPKTLVPPDDGSASNAEWYAKEGARSGATVLWALHETEHMKTTCGLCAETFEGTFGDGRVWFERHRAERHP
jgi:hypothetical protein